MIKKIGCDLKWKKKRKKLKEKKGDLKNEI